MYWCKEHKRNPTHDTENCYVLLMRKEGKEPGKKKCRMCHEEDHLFDECPFRHLCTDLDANGKYKKQFVCTNCGGKGHAPHQCPYEIEHWRMSRNSKALFEAIRNKEQFVPVATPTRLRNGAPNLPHAPVAAPQVVEASFQLQVTGPTEWTETEITFCTSLAQDISKVNNDEKTLTLTFESEVEVVAALNAIDGQLGPNGDTFTAKRHTVTSTRLTITPTIATPTPALSTSSHTSIQQAVEQTMSTHMSGVSTALESINQQLKSLDQRQAKSEENQQLTSQILMQLSNRMGAVESTCGITQSTPTPSASGPQEHTQSQPTPPDAYGESNLTAGDKTWAVVNNTVYHVLIDEVILDKANPGVRCRMLNFAGQPEGNPGFVGRDNIHDSMDAATTALATATNKRAKTTP